MKNKDSRLLEEAYNEILKNKLETLAFEAGIETDFVLEEGLLKNIFNMRFGKTALVMALVCNLFGVNAEASPDGKVDPTLAQNIQKINNVARAMAGVDMLDKNGNKTQRWIQVAAQMDAASAKTPKRKTPEEEEKEFADATKGLSPEFLQGIKSPAQQQPVQQQPAQPQRVQK
jgi:hypothetical protein